MVRQPAVAGTFYPAEADRLRATVLAPLDGVAVPTDEPLAAGYVVPHAGYLYSGPTAAHAYARLRAHAGAVRRVVLLGPSHFVPLAGCAVPRTDTWLTPLGEVAIDTATAGALVDGGHAAADDLPHAAEHSLEVQLPFLQVACGPAVSVVPVVVGRASSADVAALLAAVAGPDSVVLCSTDLSHYEPVETTRARDRRTVEAVLDRAPERIAPGDACGVYALRGALDWASRSDLHPELLDLRTSADAPGGDRGRAVGYAAIAFRTSTLSGTMSG